jgi:hypothetical protein
MAQIKSLSNIAEKWTRVTPMRTEDYRLGIENPRRDWQKETAAASDRYKQGVDIAHTKGMFTKGVNRAGSQKWKNNSLKKGPSRFAEGVTLAGDDYRKGFAPYREVIQQTTLPPRFPKGDPRNIQRVAAIAKALSEKRLQMG